MASDSSITLARFVGATVVAFTLAAFAQADDGKENRGRPTRVDPLGDLLPERMLFRIGTTRLQHSGAVEAVAISDDGRLLASCGRDKVLQVWDARDGKPVRKFALPTWGPWAVTFSRDGSELAAVSKAAPNEVGAFRRWDLKTGRELTGNEHAPAEFRGFTYYVALACRADGTYLAAESAEPEIALHTPGDPRSLKKLSGHTGRIMHLSFTRDAKILVSLDTTGMIRFWNTADGKELATAQSPPMKPERAALDGNLACIAVSPDAKTLAVSLPDDSTRIIDAKGEELRRLPTKSQLSGMAFSSDGKALITGGRLVERWRVADAKPIPIVNEPQASMLGLSLSPDGRIAAGVSSTERVRWVEVATGKVLLDREVGCQSGIAFSPDGKLFATVQARNQIDFWEIAKLLASPNAFASDPAAVLRCEDKVKLFMFAPDGKRLATVEDSRFCRIYDVASKRLAITIKPEGRSIYALAFSADGKIIATMSEGSQRQQDTAQAVRLWDSATGKEIPTDGDLRRFTHSLAFHPNGKTVAGLLLPTLASNSVPAGAIDLRSFDGRSPLKLPLDERMESIRLWDIGVKHERLRFDDPVQRKVAEGDNGWVVGRSQAVPAVFSPDGSLLATSAYDGIVLFETASGQPRLRLHGLVGNITALAFTPDGNTLVSTNWDSTITIWDVTGSRTTPRLKATQDESWRLLADADVEKAGQAVFAMADAPADSLKLIRSRVKPVSVTAEAIDKLVTDLDHPRFATREQAAKELGLLGTIAEAALRKKLAAKPSPETVVRIEKLLILLKSVRPTPEQLRELRAVEILERTGSRDAAAFLRELAAGTSGAPLTRAAAEAVERIDRQAKRQTTAEKDP